MLLVAFLVVGAQKFEEAVETGHWLPVARAADWVYILYPSLLQLGLQGWVFSLPSQLAFSSLRWSCLGCWVTQIRHCIARKTRRIPARLIARFPRSGQLSLSRHLLRYQQVSTFLRYLRLYLATQHLATDLRLIWSAIACVCLSRRYFSPPNSQQRSSMLSGSFARRHTELRRLRRAPAPPTAVQ